MYQKSKLEMITDLKEAYKLKKKKPKASNEKKRFHRTIKALRVDTPEKKEILSQIRKTYKVRKLRKEV
jgi:hypothetical protein